MSAAVPPHRSTPLGTVVRWLLLVLVTGTLGGLALDRGSDVFQIPEEISRLAPNSENPEDIARMRGADLAKQTKDAALGVGLAGLLVGAGFGLGVAGAAWRSRNGMLALAAGLVCGGVIAAAAGVCGVMLDHRLRMNPALDDGQRAMLIHGVMWSLIALGIGFATRAPVRGVRVAIRHAAIGVLGGILGAVVYTPLAAVLFPLLNSSFPVPEGTWNRVLWVLVPSLLIALLAARSSIASATTVAAGPAHAAPSPSS